VVRSCSFSCDFLFCVVNLSLTRSIADLRLQNQRITRPLQGGPEKVVAWLGAVQAQEYGPAKWGLALRSRRTTDAAIERAIDAGRLVRTHVLRPTWHFVTPGDLRWMLELTAPRVQRLMSNYDRRLGLHANIMTRATTVFERALGDHGYLTRRELGVYLHRAGLPSRSMELAHIAMHAELQGVICSGPRRGKQSTYALLEHRCPAAPRLERDEALAELTRRYFRSHGPATVRDFVWWSGLKTTDIKRGLEINRARKLELDGLTYWTVGRDSGVTRSKTILHLLPIYDEFLVAYRDHRVVPRPAYALGNFMHALVIGGKVAGTWRTTSVTKGVAVTVEALRRLTPTERRALDQAVTLYRRFLGLPVSLSVT
jgi:winged helix DNA-binding protein